MERKEIEEKVRTYVEEALKASLLPRLEKAKEEIRVSFDKSLHLEYSFRSLILVLLIGVLLGAGAKLAASETFTIGNEDYMTKGTGEIYDINAMQKKLLEDGGTLAVTRNPSGEMCTE